MLALTRYRVPASEGVQFAELARPALAALTGRPGCLGGWVGRNVDDPELWTLTTSWENVGAYRRALSSMEVKLHAVPLMYRAIDEPSGYQDLLRWSPQTGLTEQEGSLVVEE
jgi:hypothetical protein